MMKMKKMIGIGNLSFLLLAITNCACAQDEIVIELPQDKNVLYTVMPLDSCQNFDMKISRNGFDFYFEKSAYEEAKQIFKHLSQDILEVHILSRLIESGKISILFMGQEALGIQAKSFEKTDHGGTAYYFNDHLIFLVPERIY